MRREIGSMIARPFKVVTHVHTIGLHEIYSAGEVSWLALIDPSGEDEPKLFLDITGQPDPMHAPTLNYQDRVYIAINEGWTLAADALIQQARFQLDYELQTALTGNQNTSKTPATLLQQAA
ncbi:hypothetical protein [Polycladidibacter hongkongensis]|uniref:hypothetical protein n=1 Tax=Polycladidibacter hongkongensis TaxID=1647556 RepID=UPI00082F508F|nr:hypothetical protein [Pseudovibrio hongkongensis]